MKDFLTINETVQATGLGQRYVRDGVRAGNIPHIRCGKKYLVNIRLFREQLDKASKGESLHDTGVI